MEFNQCRDTLVMSMVLLETANEELDSVKCDSVIDVKIKELLQEQIKTAIADVLNITDTLYEVELALEDENGYGNGI